MACNIHRQVCISTCSESATAQEVIYNPVSLRIHSSSASSFAELRFSGSHCNILRIICRNLSLFSPLRVVSLCSSGVISCNKAVSRNSPVSEKNFWLCLARVRRLRGGGPRRFIISARWALLLYAWNSGSWPVNNEPPSKIFQIYNRVRGASSVLLGYLLSYHASYIPDIDTV